MRFIIQDDKSREAIVSYIRKLNEGKKYEALISLKKEKRTIPQNRLYWLYLTCISDETGMDKEDLHVHFKRKYLQKEEIVLGNEVVMSTYSTTELTTKQFTDYINKIVAFASSELGIVLPDPADMYWEQFYDQYKHRA